MSSLNNSYGKYSYNFNSVHKALDKDKNGHVSQAEIEAYQQRLASNNTSSGKRAKNFLSDLLSNFDKVQSLHKPAWGMQPPEDVMQRADEEEKLGISISDIGQLAYGYGNQHRLERLDFSNMKNYHEVHGYPP